MSGKGDTPRAVNGTLFRRNWDGIFMTKPKQYPDWICNQCGRLHGKRPEGNSVATYHIGRCGVCGTGGIEVTECQGTLGICGKDGTNDLHAPPHHTVCYLITAAGFYREGNVGLSVAFLGYSFANFGFLYICVNGQP
jgi:hypothetical protein